jgi:hypothetical protein
MFNGRFARDFREIFAALLRGYDRIYVAIATCATAFAVYVTATL